MKVNMLEAKSQLSRLVKSALAGEEVVIASNGHPMVKLVPVSNKEHLRGWGKWKRFREDIDAAFSQEVDALVADNFESH